MTRAKIAFRFISIDVPLVLLVEEAQYIFFQTDSDYLDVIVNEFCLVHSEVAYFF